MPEMGKYRTENYTDRRGRKPVEDFMTNLNRTGQAKGTEKIIREARLLRDSGLALGFPHISHLRGDLWELRAGFAKNEYRVLFYEAGDGLFVFLHGCIERDGLDEADMATAERRMADDRVRRRAS
jgi:hypothetical protein